MMRKSCCIGDANFTPKSSSCSMVLRSACTHGYHSHNSSTGLKSQYKEVNSLNKRFLERSTFHSFLEEKIYNHLDCSKKLEYKSTNEKEASPQSFDDVYSLECCHINNNYITSNYIEKMPRDFSRSRIDAVNALSDSENEEIITKGTLKKRLSRISSTSKSSTVSSNNNSHHNSVHRNNATYEATLQTGANSNHYTPTSSILYNTNTSNSQGSDGSSTTASTSATVIDISNVQYTLIDRFRWFLWRSIYLKIIRCVNFDVWLLSRSSNYRKVLVLLLLVPFLIYLLSGINSKNFIGFEELNSKAYAFSSSIYSFASSPFPQQESTPSDFSSKESSSSSCSQKAYDVMSDISSRPGYFFFSLYSSIRSFLNTKSELELDIERLKDDVSKLEKNFHFENSPVVKDDSANKMLVSNVDSLRLELQSLTESVKKLEKDLSLKSERSSSKYTNAVEDHKIKSLEDKLWQLNIALKSCCDQKWTVADFTASFEKHFLAALKTVVERDKDKNSPYYFFNEWLQTKLSGNKEILSQLKFEFEKMKATGAKYDEAVVENVIKKYVESMKKDFTFNKVELSGGTFSLDEVQNLIRKAILLYDSDKTGKVDYALESGGGSVLSTRCSESYAEKDGTISVLGFPLWSIRSSPRTVIQPGMQPGECWAFKGSQGFLVIQLSYTILVTGFTVEHIPLALSPSESIDSAPKDFSVWGLLSEKDNEGKLLGLYSFDQHGDSLQYFPVQEMRNEAFSFVELKILSNWGNLEYTCLYRFRVHGKQPKH